MRRLIFPVKAIVILEEICVMLSRDHIWHDPGFIHIARIQNLRPDTRYLYRYGSMKFLIFGDMGKAERDDSLEHYIQLSALQVTDAMAKEVVDVIFHIGDLSYVTGFLAEWDHFLEMIKLIRREASLSLPCIYLWTLPLFHFNGCSSFPQVTAKGIFAAIAEHNVTNFGAAPMVLNMIISAATGSTFSRLQHRQVRIMTTGAAPLAAVLAKIEALRFHVMHVYGLTETYGPCTVCEWNPEWDSLSPNEQARLKAWQGVKYVFLDGLQGHLNNPQATLESFRGGWFHSGDLAVWHPNGYIEIKDIIISGGENIGSLEVESILYRHPAVLEAAVVAGPDEKWGESPCAFVSLKHSVRRNEEEILLFCRQHLPKFMVPKSVIILAALDKTATGKIQKQVLRSKARALGSIKQISKL
ncbi:hypothetical protein SELMODRAFT_421195 [Selaginella moellendorffii]|uniref:AMP-dependent synthetase/ligase domain-containing protein n=1 Tax=Selaginella moellendorffii TaxID=88036 RepID=D8SEB5_SELML|nr:hypothetical protein SELMODRAFT_421195 [Selaginella moellendorffii]